MAGLQLLWRKSEFSKYFCMVSVINVVCFIPKGNKKFHNEVISLEFCNVPSEGTLNTNSLLRKSLFFDNVTDISETVRDRTTVTNLLSLI